MRANLFPLHLQAGDQTFRTVRFYGTDDYSEAWGLEGQTPVVVATGSGLVKQARSAGERFADGTKAKWVLILADGSTWLASPAGGCACGHKLKHFDPSKVVRT